MKRTGTFFKIVLLFAVLLIQSACGKMSDPQPIENSGYPHIYPKI